MINVLSKKRCFIKDKWEYVYTKRKIVCSKSVIIICDVWDRHWDLPAEQRTYTLAEKINKFIKIVRTLGIKILHSPHDTDDYYQNHPCMLSERFLDTTIDMIDPVSIRDVYHRTESPIKPISKHETRLVWSKQNSIIEIDNNDYISTDPYRIFGLFKQLGIENIFYVGCHLNACIMWRQLGIIQAKQLYYNAFFIEELVDILYDNSMVPYVNHEKAIEIMQDFIISFFTDSVSIKEFPL